MLYVQYASCYFSFDGVKKQIFEFLVREQKRGGQFSKKGNQPWRELCLYLKLLTFLSLVPILLKSCKAFKLNLHRFKNVTLYLLKIVNMKSVTT